MRALPGVASVLFEPVERADGGALRGTVRMLPGTRIAQEAVLAVDDDFDSKIVDVALVATGGG
ncbi:MAG: hypothetical protein L0216_01825 [Planctomycetales bacterium]|nr:hypothetical protein [Planctomycetales bacterium]